MYSNRVLPVLHMQTSPSVTSIKTGAWVIYAVISLSLLAPPIANWSQFSPANTRTSLWVSLGSLIFMIVLAVYHKKGRLPILGWKPLALLMAASLFLTLITCPFTVIEPCMIPASTLILATTLSVCWLLLRRHCFILLLPILFIGMMELGSYLQYHTILNSMVLTEAFECAKDELMVYVTPNNITGIILGWLVLGAAAYGFTRFFRQQHWKNILGTVVCFAGLMGVFFPLIPTCSPSCSRVSAVGTYKRISRALKETRRDIDETVKEFAALPSPAEKPSSLPTLKGNEGCIIVLHIGESVRADRLGCNGYPRNTTPNLSRNPRLITWKRCISAAGTTVPSIPVILTNARRCRKYDHNAGEEMMASCGSVMHLFKANGFEIHSFFGALSRQSIRADRMLRLLTSASDHKYYTKDDVQYSVHQIQECLKQRQNQNLFLLINNEGSHAMFYMYDQENPPFTPSMHSAQAASSHKEAVCNAYDNTIHYTDKFVHRVLQALEGRPYVYVYVSDHGEYLGDYGGTWGRGRVGSEYGFYHSTQACAVGAFAICSKEYEALNPAFAKAAAQLKSSSRMTIGHEHFFHTLLGLVGMQTPYYQPELDLCSPQAREYDGLQPDDWPDYLSLDK